MTELVTVVITSYNKGQFLKESLESVLNQSHTHLEIYVVDNQSFDGTKGYLNSVVDPRLKVIYNSENIGPVASLNKMLSQKLEGNYIAIQHADDVWLPNKLETQLEYFRQNPTWDACFTGAETIDVFGNPINDPNEFYFDAFDFFFENTRDGLERLLTRGNFICMPSIMFRKNVLNEIGLFSPQLALLNDFDLWIKLFSRFEVGMTKESLTKFRVGSDNESAVNDTNINRSRNEAFIVLNEYFKHLKVDDKSFVAQLNLFKEATSDAAKLALLSSLSEISRTDKNPKHIGQLREAIDSFEASEITALKSQVKSLSLTIEEIQESASWRVTSPLRKLASTFRTSSKKAEKL
jgi:glycosyltransferase involved in cell wall biosynthesis